MSDQHIEEELNEPMSKIRLDLDVRRSVKGRILEASKRTPNVKFNSWALNTLISASQTALDGEGFYLSTKGGQLVVKGNEFSIPLQTDEATAREFVDFLNVAIGQANSARVAGNT
ncbi:hypothetical protein [Marinimicrobium sp. ABcell2]|uniref:hypothetical protein n=1 Tax=Marinimicrobium sp. ABcell2 TaxID=3069751 RepID=UPI0027AE47CC|nr:hypothetical protein [Marinimicrobium sp. ABcell2]MDQ2077417.1 hypothetical protein [Marinimicrobium sp. ABcell2]